MGLKRLWFCLVSAAAFFVTYEYTKSLLGAGGAFALPHVAPVTHMLAASLGEVVSLPVPHPPSFCLLSSGFISLFHSVHGTLLSLFFLLFVLISMIPSTSTYRRPAVITSIFFFALLCSCPCCFFPTTVCPKWKPLVCLLMLLPFEFHRPLFRGVAGEGLSMWFWL